MNDLLLKLSLEYQLILLRLLVLNHVVLEYHYGTLFLYLHQQQEQQQ